MHAYKGEVNLFFSKYSILYFQNPCYNTDNNLVRGEGSISSKLLIHIFPALSKSLTRFKGIEEVCYPVYLLLEYIYFVILFFIFQIMDTSFSI